MLTDTDSTFYIAHDLCIKLGATVRHTAWRVCITQGKSRVVALLFQRSAHATTVIVLHRTTPGYPLRPAHARQQQERLRRRQQQRFSPVRVQPEPDAAAGCAHT
jgi:hypothetical protein